MKTIERINQLAAERAALFRLAMNGRRGDPVVLARVQAIDAELERLWELRRQERAGRADGIDALINKAYEEVYGPDDAVYVSTSPMPFAA